MSFSNTSYDSFEEVTPVEGASATITGTGGGTMDIWKENRVTILKTLTEGTFENKSAFEIPAGITDGGNPYDSVWEDEETKHGVNVDGKFLDENELPLSGTASIEQGESTLTEKSITAQFFLTAPAPDGVTTGSDVSTTQYDFRFSPARRGVDYTQDNMGQTLSTGLVTYGKLDGTITDVNGEAVGNSSWSAPGVAGSTDSTGAYEVLAPGGNTFEFTVLAGSLTENVTPTGGGTQTRDYQFGGLRVSLQIPDGTGIPNVRVASDDVVGAAIATKSDGEAVFTKAKVSGTLEADISNGRFTVSTSSPSQGSIADASKETGYGVKGIVQDSADVEVGNVDVQTDAQNPLVAQANADGTFIVGDDGTGDVVISFAQTDRRYEQNDVTYTVTTGSLFDNQRITLVQKENIGTTT